jgi:hypothetical protein
MFAGASTLADVEFSLLTVSHEAPELTVQSDAVVVTVTVCVPPKEDRTTDVGDTVMLTGVVGSGGVSSFLL